MRSRLLRTAATTLAALLLVACSTPAERELHRVSLASEQLWADYDVCMARIEGTSAYQRLDRAYVLAQNDPRSVEKMAIGRLASDQEKADLLQNQKNERQCNQELFKGFAQINPSFNVLLSRFMSEDDELVLRTIQDEVTVGDRNRIVQQRFAERLRDWNFAGERLVRLHTWRLRRACSVHCSSFSAGSLLPTATAGSSNLASVTPLPGTAGQDASLPQATTNSSNSSVAAPAAPQAQPSDQTAAPQPEAATAPVHLNPAAPAAEPPEATAKPAAAQQQSAAPAVTPLPGAPKPKAAATAAAATTAQPPANRTAAPAQEAKQSATTKSRPAPTVLTPPAADAETGLQPAAAPETAATAQKAKPVQLAQTTQTSQATQTASRPVYTVHLASMDSEVEARAEWGKLQARFPAILGDRVLFTREVTIGGKGTYVRVLTGLFHERGQAKELCGRLEGGLGVSDQYCAILKL